MAKENFLLQYTKQKGEKMIVQSIKKTGVKRIALLAVLSVLLALSMMPMSANAAVNDVLDYTSYKIDTTSDPDDPDPTQHVVLNFTYPSGTVIDPFDSVAAADAFTITIAGYNITTDPVYQRDISVYGAGSNILTVDIGPVTTGGQTADYNGIITVDTSDLGSIITANDSTDELDDITGIDTVIVSEVQFVNLSVPPEGTIGSVTLTIGSQAAVRGMVHFGLYYQDVQGGPLLPVWTGVDPGSIGVDTYTVHAMNFYAMTPDRIAAALEDAVNTSASFPSHDFAFTNSGATVILSAIAGSAYVNKPLFIYVFDDDLIQALNNAGATGTTYSSIRLDGGQLPIVPLY
ncbi:MAG: hypothetical protein LBS91_01530 [Clostridiales Family XIII bacterium]|nr:hypothetical protein [Clostridiales Family XIII bacterium]